MTTIAYDGKILAADGRATVGNLISAKKTQKIFPLKALVSGVEILGVLAGAGSYQSIMQVKQHIERADLFEAVEVPDLEPGSFTGLLVLETGEAFILEDRLIPMPVELPTAIGSGTDYAMTAMHLGKSSFEGVQAACELDCYSGGEISRFDTTDWKFL